MPAPLSVTRTLPRAGAAAPRGAKSRYRHMNAEIAAEIRRRYFAREATQAALGREYGIRQHSVSRIVSGLSWVRPGARCATRPPADVSRGSGGNGVPRR